MGSSAIRLRISLSRILNSSTKFPNISCNAARTYLVTSFNLGKSLNSQSNGINSFYCKTSSNLISLNRTFSSDAPLGADAIAQKVLHVCKTFDKIPADKLSLESHFMNDLGLDSLDHVELIMNIEDDFNFEIPDADAEKLLRVKDVVEYIIQKDISTVKQ